MTAQTILPANTLSGGYDVANSVRFNGGDSAKFNIDHSGAGNRDLWTLSMWVKRSSLGAEEPLFNSRPNANFETFCGFAADNTLVFKQKNDGSSTGEYVTTRKFRDVSAWYHFVFVYDKDNSTAGNRGRIYVNGVEETLFGTESNFSDSSTWNSTNTNNIGNSQSAYFDGYMCEIVFIDGQALTPASFGEFDSDSSSIWKPIDVSGLTPGTNGFWLDFEDGSNLGNNAFGSGSADWTETNIAATEQSTDTCTNNFATWNGLDFYHNATANTGSTSSEGNLRFANASGNKGFARSTFAVSTGKWYWEIEANAVGKGFYGVCHEGIMVDGTALQPSAVYYYEAVPDFRSGDQIITTNAVSISAGDILGFALDMDNSALYISKNGTYMNSGNPGSGSSRTGSIAELFNDGRAVLSNFGAIFANVANTSTSGALDASANFGSPHYSESGGNADGNGYGNFKTAPPSGYYSLNTKNLAEYG